MNTVLLSIIACVSLRNSAYENKQSVLVKNPVSMELAGHYLQPWKITE